MMTKMHLLKKLHESVPILFQTLFPCNLPYLRYSTFNLNEENSNYLVSVANELIVQKISSNPFSRRNICKPAVVNIHRGPIGCG